MSGAKLQTQTPQARRDLLARLVARRKEASTPAGPAQVTEPGHDLLVRLGPERPTAALRLVLLAPLAAGTSYYAGWGEALPSTIETWALRLPGREGLDAPLLTAEASLRAALDPVATHLAHGGPIALFGHSMGAHVARLLAEMLEAAGTPPVHLFISACAPPNVPDGFHRIDEYDNDELLRRLCQPAAGETAALDSESRAALLQRARADGRLAGELRTRQPAPLSCSLTVLGARDDTDVPSQCLVGWQEYAGTDFTLRILPGDHDMPRTQRNPLLSHLERTLVPTTLRTVEAAPQGKDEAAELEFGLFFFSCNEADYQHDRYRLVRESVRWADQNGFCAAWFPERHFHPVGGLFPNPSVLAGALAMETQRIRLRSGSVVMPLHDPIRVAEEWSVVDNLSGGRVELSFVPGWNPNDFALAPAAYEDRWDHTFERLEQVRSLWRGEALQRRNGVGADISVHLHPAPCQPELPVWITTSARDESFVRAGEQGFNIFTALLIQSVDEVARRVRLYREARDRAGHDPEAGRVALMVHTFVGLDEADTRAAVRGPFIDYMHSVQSLWKDNAKALRLDSEKDKARVIDLVYERYFQQATLFGSVQECIDRATAYRKAGADEIACAIDFGTPFEATLASLARLTQVRRHFLTPPQRAGQEVTKP
ncbi:MAG: LLM class flavin-dependent oxidoreductase [Candidatus Latescibacteria bacterium]|nr:LLM class flavin-dependent oxidoreductase [Candidatus Latescibacterota bacterium]